MPQSFEQPDFQWMADNTPVVMWTARPDGTIAYVNKFGLNFLGRTLDDLKDWSWVEIADPNELELIGETWSHALETGEPYEIVMSLRCAKNGTLRPHRARAQAMRDETGKIVCWLGAHIEL
jgi:PAS domain S-box-containing protein